MLSHDNKSSANRLSQILSSRLAAFSAKTLTQLATNSVTLRWFWAARKKECWETGIKSFSTQS